MTTNLPTESYIRLLNERKPEALILFAHYCVLLAYCDYSWYFHGVGRRFVAAIWRSLPPHWRRWISWPVIATGAVVDDNDDDEGSGDEREGSSWGGENYGEVKRWEQEVVD